MKKDFKQAIFSALILIVMFSAFSVSAFAEDIWDWSYFEDESEAVSEYYEEITEIESEITEETTEDESEIMEETTDTEPERPEFLLGDVNSDGFVKANDARLTLRVVAGLDKLKSIHFYAADYNQDGQLTAADARYILRVSAGLDPFAPSQPEKTKLIKADLICQFPDYPVGCEIVAAVMNLRYLGFNISVDKFIESYLPIGIPPTKLEDVWYSSDPNESFLGDPASDKGWGIWAKGMETAINRYLDTQDVAATVTCTYSETLESLCENYVYKGTPVLVWVTVGMETPRENISPIILGTEDKTFTWISPNHCMLLVGFDRTGYYFNDPTTGKLEKYTKDASNAAFVGNGSQALIITVNK